MQIWRTLRRIVLCDEAGPHRWNSLYIAHWPALHHVRTRLIDESSRYTVHGYSALPAVLFVRITRPSHWAHFQ